MAVGVRAALVRLPTDMGGGVAVKSMAGALRTIIGSGVDVVTMAGLVPLVAGSGVPVASRVPVDAGVRHSPKDPVIAPDAQAQDSEAIPLP